MTIESQMKRDIVPPGDRVLVRLKPVEEVSKGGIILHGTAKSAEKEQYAVQEAYVVRVGWDAWVLLGSGKPWCKVGDCVLIKKYSGEDLDDIEDGVLYRVISDEDIVAVFRGEEWHD